MRLCGLELLELRSRECVARIAPEAGGRLVSLAWTGADGPVDLLVPWDGSPFDEHAWPKAGAFPMLPFANRLPGAALRFGRRTVQAEKGPEGVALHGFAHRRPWQVAMQSPERVRLRFEHDGPRSAWPWSWSAELEFLLVSRGLGVTLRVRNESTEPMPLGMGWHPYHPAGESIERGDLRFEARARRDLDAEGRAGSSAAAPVFDMRAGETAAFEGWQGRADLRLSTNARLSVQCIEAPHLVVHRPVAGAYLCLEPVSILPGRLGSEMPAPGPGVLLPGQMSQLSWTCRFEPND